MGILVYLPTTTRAVQETTSARPYHISLVDKMSFPNTKLNILDIHHCYMLPKMAENTFRQVHPDHDQSYPHSSASDHMVAGQYEPLGFASGSPSRDGRGLDLVEVLAMLRSQD